MGLEFADQHPHRFGIATPPAPRHPTTMPNSHKAATIKPAKAITACRKLKAGWSRQEVAKLEKMAPDTLQFLANETGLKRQQIQEHIGNLSVAIMGRIVKRLAFMPTAEFNAISARDMAVVFGILSDKLPALFGDKSEVKPDNARIIINFNDLLIQAPNNPFSGGNDLREPAQMRPSLNIIENESQQAEVVQTDPVAPALPPGIEIESQ